MSTVKRIVNILLSFILAVLLTVLTLAGTLQFTLLNENFILDNMNTCNYITEKKDEITSSLTDLGYASGLEEDFFSDLLNEVMLHDDVEKYLSDYYSGKGSVIDKTAFKQTFNTALDKYIKKKGIDPNSVSSDNREYLIKEAAKIYKQSLELPFFGKLAGRFQNLKTIVPYVMAVCLILSIINYCNLYTLHKVETQSRKIYLLCNFGNIFVNRSSAVDYLAVKEGRNL